MPRKVEDLRKTRKRVSQDQSTLGTDLWASRLTDVPDDEIYSIIRWSILRLISTIPDPDGASGPQVRALRYLYSLARFIEALDRFPSKEEQGYLFELTLLESRDSSPSTGAPYLPEMSVLLAQAARSSKSRRLRASQQKKKGVMEWSQEDEDLFLGSPDEQFDQHLLSTIHEMKRKKKSHKDILTRLHSIIEKGGKK
jgi:hypothetical protein